MDIKAVLLDTSFIIRLLSESDNLHDNAKAYYKHFLEHGVEMKFSTISIAEYCVIGDVAELPLRNLKIIPFNFDHAQRAGQFAAKVYSARNGGQLPEIKERMLIPNDTKLFSQADLDSSIQYFVTSDTKSKNVITLLSSECGARLQHLDIHTPVNEFLGELF
jgi:hypothetical protein